MFMIKMLFKEIPSILLMLFLFKDRINFIDNSPWRSPLIDVSGGVEKSADVGFASPCDINDENA